MAKVALLIKIKRALANRATAIPHASSMKVGVLLVVVLRMKVGMLVVVLRKKVHVLLVVLGMK